MEVKGKRRLLHSAGSLHLVAALRSLMLGLYVEEDVERVLPLQVPINSSLFVCMKCFRSLERFVKVKKELDDGISNVGEKLMMRSASLSSAQPLPALQSTPSRKRRSDGSTPLAKRQRIDTPVQDVISRIQAPNTPLVSVSSTCIFSKFHVDPQYQCILVILFTNNYYDAYFCVTPPLGG